jgi:hypothetical protein
VSATLAFDDVIGRSGRRERDGFVAVKTSKDAVAVRKAVRIELEVSRVRTAAASAILEAITLARQGQLDLARKRLANAADVVRAASTRLADPELAKIISQLEEVTKQLAQLVAAAEPEVDSMQSVGLTDAAPSRVRAPATAPAAVEVKLRKAEDKAAKSVSGRDE